MRKIVNTPEKVRCIPSRVNDLAMHKIKDIQLKRVAAYCRVSTDLEGQASSLELQKQYYAQHIRSNQDWEFVGIYADEGLSGTSSKKRPEFIKMINECKKGNIDIIMTKSISRFSRNTLECLNYVRQLKDLSSPVAVWFERENINTLDSSSDLLLNILASVAQEESRTISENRKWSITRRYEMGNPFFPTNYFLGYENDEDGNIIINEEEADIVRRIYREYLLGMGTRLIADGLNEDGLKTGRGNKWHTSSVYRIISNEKYMGDVRMQKTFVADYLTHKAITNRGEKPQYYYEGYHPPIISKEVWETAQREKDKRATMWQTDDSRMRTRHDTKNQIANLLICGCCGSPMRRIASDVTASGQKYTVQNWRCRAATYPKYHINCNAERWPEWAILSAFLWAEKKTHRNPKVSELAMAIKNEIDAKYVEARVEEIRTRMRQKLAQAVIHPQGSIVFSFYDGRVVAIPLVGITREDKTTMNQYLYKDKKTKAVALGK